MILSPGQIQANPGEVPPHPHAFLNFWIAELSSHTGWLAIKPFLFLNKVFLCSHKWKCTQILPEFILSGPLDKECLTKGEWDSGKWELQMAFQRSLSTARFLEITWGWGRISSYEQVATGTPYLQQFFQCSTLHFRGKSLGEKEVVFKKIFQLFSAPLHLEE